MVTRPNWMAPFHMERATDNDLTLDALACSRRAGQRLYHPAATNPAQSEVAAPFGAATNDGAAQPAVEGPRGCGLASDGVGRGESGLDDELVRAPDPSLGLGRPQEMGGVEPHDDRDDDREDDVQPLGKAEEERGHRARGPTDVEPEERRQDALVHGRNSAVRPGLPPAYVGTAGRPLEGASR